MEDYVKLIKHRGVSHKRYVFVMFVLPSFREFQSEILFYRLLYIQELDKERILFHEIKGIIKFD